MQCSYCGCSLNADNKTKDHVIPKVKGGSNAKSNLKDCCIRCNQNKRSLSLEQFRFKFFLGETFYYEKLEAKIVIQSQQSVQPKARADWLM